MQDEHFHKTPGGGEMSVKRYEDGSILLGVSDEDTNDVAFIDLSEPALRWLHSIITELLSDEAK